MSRFIAIIFFLLLLLSPIAVLASESSNHEIPSNNLIPVFFFGDQYDGLLTIAPIEDDFFTWSYSNQEKILIGNITNKSDIGSYTYSQTSKTNPHAVTSAGPTIYTYDSNGNITSDGTHTYTWDYNNRLTSSTAGDVTYNYSYDHEGNRVKKVQGSNTTIYVNRYYEIDPSGKITKHIYGVDDRIALVETLSGVKTPYYVHKDHLGGSSVITDSSGNKVELADYYPYGSTRLDEKAGSFESKYKFTGKELDGETGLYYYGQRYYDPAIGRFASEDPAHLLIGDTKFKSRFERDLSQHLTDPQGLNSYSYANNNPLKYTDPDGEIIPLIALPAIMWAATEIGISAYDAYSTVKDLGNSNLSTGQKLGSVGLFAAGLAMPGGGYKTGVDGVLGVAAKLTPNSSNYRTIFQKTFGNLKPNVQIHHTLPQKYENLFKNTGINIHEMKYLEAVPKDIHQEITNTWRQWDKAQNGNITPQKVQNFSNQIKQQFGKNFQKIIDK